MVTGIYLLIGVVVGLAFVPFIPRRFDPDAAAGSRGFRLAILPGVIALWPLILVKVAALWRGKNVEADAERPASPERLRRRHGIAFVALACVGPVLFAVALIWRAPRWEDLPPVDLPDRASRHFTTPIAGEGQDR